jgi:hypothetical protein
MGARPPHAGRENSKCSPFYNLREAHYKGVQAPSRGLGPRSIYNMEQETSDKANSTRSS